MINRRGEYPPEWEEASLRTKIEAGFRCIRCGHPNGRWCPSGTDPHQAIEVLVVRGIFQDSPGHVPRVYFVDGGAWVRSHLIPCDEHCTHDPEVRDHRVLTVHHLDGAKDNLAPYNLCALCQRCHLTIQGKVDIEQVYLHPHSDWFIPYYCGWIAFYELGLVLSLDEARARSSELLPIGQPWLYPAETRDASDV